MTKAPWRRPSRARGGIRPDDAWMAAMRADPIASKTDNARYLRAGQGAPGSPLRAAYERCDAARRAWYKTVGWED